MRNFHNARISPCRRRNRVEEGLISVAYIKQLLNSVLVGYEELLRPRFVLSAEAEG